MEAHHSPQVVALRQYQNQSKQIPSSLPATASQHKLIRSERGLRMAWHGTIVGFPTFQKEETKIPPPRGMYVEYIQVPYLSIQKILFVNPMRRKHESGLADSARLIFPLRPA